MYSVQINPLYITGIDIPGMEFSESKSSDHWNRPELMHGITICKFTYSHTMTLDRQYSLSVRGSTGKNINQSPRFSCKCIQIVLARNRGTLDLVRLGIMIPNIISYVIVTVNILTHHSRRGRWDGGAGRRGGGKDGQMEEDERMKGWREEGREEGIGGERFGVSLSDYIHNAAQTPIVHEIMKWLWRYG